MWSRLGLTGPTLPIPPPWFVPYCTALGVGSSRESVDISPAGDIRPVSLENGSAGWLVLDLSDASPSELFDGEVESSDP